jgi:hypothetical protein
LAGAQVAAAEEESSPCSSTPPVTLLVVLLPFAGRFTAIVAVIFATNVAFSFFAVVGEGVVRVTVM